MCLQRHHVSRLILNHFCLFIVTRRWPGGALKMRRNSLSDNIWYLSLLRVIANPSPHSSYLECLLSGSPMLDKTSQLESGEILGNTATSLPVIDNKLL